MGIVRIHEQRRELAWMTLNCPLFTLDFFPSMRVARTRPILKIEQESHKRVLTNEQLNWSPDLGFSSLSLSSLKPLAMCPHKGTRL